jgi:hypothetical protein
MLIVGVCSNVDSWNSCVSVAEAEALLLLRLSAGD